MCGRFSLVTSKAEIAKEFKCESVALNRPRYNIAPSQDITVVINKEQNRKAVLMRWGLIPHWVKDLATWKSNLINARSETIRQKPSFRSGFKKRPCLIPASGFYEWHRSQNSSQKQPYYFQTDRDLFAFAGIYEVWTDDDTEEKILSCTILTTEAKGAIASIHHRMPVIIPAEHYNTWLVDVEERKQLRETLPEVTLKLHPVDTIVNSPKNDVPDCIAAIS